MVRSHWLAVALLWLCAACVAQTPVLYQGRPALKFRVNTERSLVIEHVYDGEPQFRFLARTVRSNPCYGIFFISRRHLFFTGGESCMDERFDVPRAQAQFAIGAAKTPHDFEVVFPGGRTKLIVDWREDAAVSPVTGYDALLRFIDLMWSDFDGAEQQYAQLTSPLRASIPPPVIAIFEPSDVQPGKVLRVSGDSVRLRGTVTSQSGIVKMEANGQAATLRQLSSQVYEFDIRLPLARVGVSPVVISAVGGDTSEAQIAFAVNRAAIEILEPVGKPESPAIALRVRGIARGFSDVQRVEIAGLPASLNRRDDGIEFELAQVPLKLGDNVLDGAVVTGDGARQPFQVMAKRLPPPGPPPLTLKEVEDALGGMPKARVIDLVKKFGVDFELSDANEQQLRSAGATPELLLVIAKARK